MNYYQLSVVCLYLAIFNLVFEVNFQCLMYHLFHFLEYCFGKLCFVTVAWNLVWAGNYQNLNFAGTRRIGGF